MSLALLEALDNFIEATQQANKVRILAPYEKRIERDFARLFKKQGALFAAEHAKYQGHYLESIGGDIFSRLMDIIFTATQQEMNEAIKLPAAEIVKRAGDNLINQLDLAVAFDVKNPEAVSWLGNHAAEMVTKVNETTRSQIASIVTQSVDEGWSYNRTAKEIRGRFNEFAVGKPQLHIQSRAHLVAVTESANAYEYSTYQTAKGLQSMGLQMEKSWLTVGDSRVTEECHANQEQGWLDIDKQFQSGSMNQQRFPGCRCTSLHQVAEEKK